jgi:hypothetical protein
VENIAPDLRVEELISQVDIPSPSDLPELGRLRLDNAQLTNKLDKLTEVRDAYERMHDTPIRPHWLHPAANHPAGCRKQCVFSSMAATRRGLVHHDVAGHPSPTHDAGGLPQGSSYFLGQPWLRPRGPEETQGAARQRRCPVKYKPPPSHAWMMRLKPDIMSRMLSDFLRGVGSRALLLLSRALASCC